MAIVDLVREKNITGWLANKPPEQNWVVAFELADHVAAANRSEPSCCCSLQRRDWVGLLHLPINQMELLARAWTVALPLLTWQQ